MKLEKANHLKLHDNYEITVKCTVSVHKKILNKITNPKAHRCTYWFP